MSISIKWTKECITMLNAKICEHYLRPLNKNCFRSPKKYLHCVGFMTPQYTILFIFFSYVYGLIVHTSNYNKCKCEM